MTGFKVGDKGQRYEVQYTDDEGTQRVMGWAETSDGVDNLTKAIKLHPSFHNPKVIDRKKQAGMLMKEKSKTNAAAKQE